LERRATALRTALLTGLALAAFAANSVLCRLALEDESIDAASFSAIRLASGAAMLVLVASLTRGLGPRGRGGNWLSGALLFLYAVPFSFAYLSLGAGTGALILFGAVQATMILAALWSGERPAPPEWLGLLLAVVGLVYLVLPGITAPSLAGSGLMVLAGVAWGLYSLRGLFSVDPLAATTDNFVRSLPFALAVSLILVSRLSISAEGAWLAVASGAVTSGLGYVIWYAALRGLTFTRAATVQLAVPVLAALGGVLFLSERVTVRLVLAGLLILGGVGLSLAGRRDRSHALPSTLSLGPILFFDGLCVLCNAWADRLLREDKEKSVLFLATLQGETSRGLLPTDLREDPRSLVLIEGGRYHTRSDAVLRTLHLLGGGWRLLSRVLSLVPGIVRDAVYDAVARKRYRWFGKRHRCRLPGEEGSGRILP
jgi:predicted DCC family thiol-disulfide oxidoreductase YuxK/drug/metabolite transporter (DMT)-like permease